MPVPFATNTKTKRRPVALLLFVLLGSGFSFLAGCEQLPAFLETFPGLNFGTLTSGKPVPNDYYDVDVLTLAATLVFELAGIDPASPSLPGTPPYFPFLMRQPNCSLTRYTVDSTATLVDQSANYQDELHASAHVPTVPDKFPHGCSDSTTGISGQDGALIGKTSGGNWISAVESADGVLVTVASPTGAFVSGGDYPTGNILASLGFGIATADLNGDGNPDMVVASETGSTTATLSVFLGKGDGTFTAGPVLPITLLNQANVPLDVTIDDVNGDSKLDLIAVTASDGTSAGVTVFLGNGDGTFSSAIPGPAGSQGQAVVTADFNGDSKIDVVTSYGQILLGNGDGTFSLSSTVIPEGPAAGVAAADFNQDGKLDLAFTNFNAGTVDVFFGNGSGAFAYSASYPTIVGAQSVQTSDIDGDGFPDLFVGTAHNGLFTTDHYTGGYFHSFLNYGDGTFGKPRAYFPGPLGAVSTPSARQLAFDVADYTGDGKADLVEVTAGLSANTTAFTVFPGAGDGTFAQTTKQTQLTNPPAPQFVAAVASGDVDGDGKNDIVFAWAADQSGSSPTISVALGKGDGTFQSQVDYSVPASVLLSGFNVTNSLILADVNGDKKPDIVFLTGGSSVPNTDGALYVMLNNGNGTFHTPTKIDSQPYFNYLATADFDGDGFADVVVNVEATVSTNSSAFLYISKGNGTFQAATPLTPGAPSSIIVATADLNGDQKPDIVFAGTVDTSNNTGNVTALLGKGDGTFASGVSSATPGHPRGIAFADLNSDGKPDVILGGQPNMYVIAGNGDGTFNTTTAGNIYSGISASTLKSVDLTGNGYPDLELLSSGNNNALSVVTFVGAKPSALPVGNTPSTATLSASATSVSSGASVTFTATVKPSTGAGVPTGSVTFLDGTSTLLTATLDSTGKATFATTSLAAGSHSVSASYSGDSTYAASTSSAVTVAVTSASAAFALTANPATSTVTAGTSATYTISVTPSGGFSSAVSLACSGAPTAVTCSLSPTSVTPNGAAATATLTVTTTARSTIVTNNRLPSIPASRLVLFCIALILSVFMLTLMPHRRARTPVLAVSSLVLVFLFVWGCGGGGSSSSGGGSTGTPAGSSTITVTGTSGSASHTTTVTLVVQ
jgi:hypothetical protein